MHASSKGTSPLLFIPPPGNLKKQAGWLFPGEIGKQVFPAHSNARSDCEAAPS